MRISIINIHLCCAGTTIERVINMNVKTVDKAEEKTLQPRCIRSHELFAGQTRIRILHEGVEYLLQITRQGKLILTK